MGAHEYDQSNRGCTAGLVRLPRGPACQFEGPKLKNYGQKALLSMPGQAERPARVWYASR